MGCSLDNIGIIGNKPAGMTTFAATGDARMYGCQECRRYETTSIHVAVTQAAFSLCRDVINFLRRGNTGVMTGCTIATHYI